MILDVARRNGAHIGFFCNGNGICTTCECKVLNGAEDLSPLTSAEKAWIGPERRSQGYRLGCQAGVTGDLVVITRVEELKRAFNGSLRPEGERAGREDNAVGFVTKLTEVTINHLVRAPVGLLESVNRVGLVRFLFPWTNLERWVDDSSRVIDTEFKRDGIELGTGRIPPADGDDLTVIDGLGIFASSRLRRAGITTYAELAATSAEDLAQQTRLRVERINQYQWREQAAKLAAEKVVRV